MNSSEPKLKKNLGVWSAMAIVVGTVIGAGVFFKPYAIYQATGGAPGAGMLAWIVGGLISLFGALTFAEVAVMKPRTGGMVAYLSEVFGERVGFMAGWMLTVIFYPAYLAGYGVKVGQELATYLGDGSCLWIAAAIIALVVFANLMGNRSAGVFQVVSTVCKLLPLALIMVFGFIKGDSSTPVFTPMAGEGKTFTGALSATLLAVLFAFEGWTNAGAIAGEMKNPSKDLPKAIVGGVTVIMAVYFLINMAYLWVIPAEELMYIESPATAVATKLFGDVGGILIKCGIIVSVIGAANGFLMSGSRVAYCLAEQKSLPGYTGLAKVNRFAVPTWSIVLVGVLAIVYSLIGNFDLLTDLATFACWIFYTLTFIAVFVLRKREPDNPDRKYRVPLYPVIPALAVLGGLYVIVSQFFLSGATARINALISVGITLIGLPVYLIMKIIAAKKEATE